MGGSANDTLTGNSGANVINGNTGADTMLGGAGNDTYYVDNVGDKVYETTTTTSTLNATGTDTVVSSVSFSLNATTGVSFVENLRLNSANAINGTGNALNNTIYAGASNNTIDGLSGTSDTVSYYYAGAGVNVDLRNTTTAQVTGGSGSDLIRNVENLAGSNFNDTLKGNTGANTLSGYNGVDTLYGLEGNDLLRGGAGNDILYGGTGQDTFRFDTALTTSTVQNLDQIKDFVVADDTIQLENAYFTKFAATGTLTSGWFQTVGATNVDGTATDDYILYNKSTGALSYDANGSTNGTTDAIQIAVIGTNLTLTHADFVII
jgi:Ca2+-binding RTX toxin-like protein